MMGKIAVTNLGSKRGGVRLGAILVWIIMGLAQIATRVTGRSISLEVIALLQLLEGIVTMRCWQQLMVRIKLRELEITELMAGWCNSGMEMEEKG